MGCSTSGVWGKKPGWPAAQRWSRALLIAGFLAMATEGAARAQSLESQKWPGWMELSGHLGSHRSLGGGEIFLPIFQTPRTLTFFDLRGLVSDGESREFSFGLGHRRMLASGWNLGGYGFLDRRRSPRDNTFHQATLGLELLSRRFDFRANLYLPLGDTRQDAPDFAAVEQVGASLQMRSGEEQALTGGDLEAGVGVPLPTWLGHRDRLDLRFYAGSFYFDGADVERVVGSRLRTELRIMGLPLLGEAARLTFEGEIQDDDLRGRQGFAGLRLRLPLNPPAARRALSYQEQRMLDRVQRDVDIQTVSGPIGAPEPLLSAEGESLGNLAAVQAGDDVQKAVDDLAPGEVLLVDGSQGEILIAGPLVLSDGQGLKGAGQVVEVVGQHSGQRALARLPGTPGTLRGTDYRQPVIHVTSGTVTIENVGIAGGDTAVRVSGAGTHLDMSLATVYGIRGDGILVTNQASARLSDIRLSDTLLNGLNISNGARVEARNLTIQRSGDNAVSVDNDAHLILKDSHISNARVGLETWGDSYYFAAGRIDGENNSFGEGVEIFCSGTNPGTVGFSSGLDLAVAGCVPQ